jgi:hypothetical protein
MIVCVVFDCDLVISITGVAFNWKKL